MKSSTRPWMLMWRSLTILVSGSWHSKNSLAGSLRRKDSSQRVGTPGAQTNPRYMLPVCRDSGQLQPCRQRPRSSCSARPLSTRSGQSSPAAARTSHSYNWQSLFLHGACAKHRKRQSSQLRSAHAFARRSLQPRSSGKLKWCEVLNHGSNFLSNLPFRFKNAWVF